jgi:hypothetical protein
LIAGITVIAKRRVMSSSVGWSILGFWFIALLGAAATLPNFLRDFRDEGIYRVAEDITIEADTLSIGINQINHGVFSSDSRWMRVNRDFDNGYSSDFTDLDIMLSSDDQFKVEKRFRSRGRNSEDAERNAENLSYNYKIEGDEITFDSELTFPSGAQFRAQEIDVTFYIPEGQPFKLERGMGNLLNYFNYNYSWWEIYNNTWMYVDGSLKCITCEESESDYSDSSVDKIRIELEAFNTIKISDKFKVFVKQGDSNSLEIEGPKNKISPVKLNIIEGVLNLSGRDFALNEDDTNEFTLYITTQELTNITLYEEVEINISEFNIDQLTLNIHDKAKASLNSSIRYLSFKIMDESQLNLENDIQKVVAILSEDSRLYAYDAIIDVVQIDADDDSRARLNVEKELFVTAEGRSSIKYKGNPRLDIKNQSSAASVSKY